MRRAGWTRRHGSSTRTGRMLWFTARRPRSGWSRPNKIRVERLLAQGLMLPAGQAAIDEAKRRGTWSLLDDVEDLVVPDDLAAALAANPPAAGQLGRLQPIGAARASWSGSSRPSGRRRERSASRETATLAARNEKANQWVPQRPARLTVTRPADPPRTAAASAASMAAKARSARDMRRDPDRLVQQLDAGRLVDRVARHEGQPADLVGDALALEQAARVVHREAVLEAEVDVLALGRRRRRHTRSCERCRGRARRSR